MKVPAIRPLIGAISTGRLSRFRVQSWADRMTLHGCDLNRSTQQSNLFVEKRNVADETETSDLLHKRAKDLDVGPLAEWRLYA